MALMIFKDRAGCQSGKVLGRSSLSHDSPCTLTALIELGKSDTERKIGGRPDGVGPLVILHPPSVRCLLPEQTWRLFL